jgi:uncharacterized membrane protein (DUF2068 family)
MAPPALPGTVKTRRFRPHFHYELISCGFVGHELLATDAERLRAEDAMIARDADGLRWHRCLRCDSWLPLEPPAAPSREFPPDRDDVEIPLRGRALRDKIVLRIIAVDRAIHFIVLAVLAAVIFAFAGNRDTLRDPVYRVLADLQSGFGKVDGKHGILDRVRHLFSIESGTLTKVGLVVSAYAIIEGVEAVGLWLMKRWAEYLTLIATAAFLPLEVYEIIEKRSPLKILTFLVNLAVVVYLLFAKRLFGLRGGADAEHAVREADAGWPALERATPGSFPS